MRGEVVRMLLLKSMGFGLMALVSGEPSNQPTLLPSLLQSHVPTALEARTEATLEQLGKVAVVCDIANNQIYLEVDYAAFVGLAAPLLASIDAPPGCPPFEHVLFSFEPLGHPAWDGKGGGYGVPHTDVHFFMISSEEREALTGNCTLYQGAGNCDVFVAANAPFFNLPDADYTTGFFEDDTFGGHAVPRHGMHLLADTDAAGPASCASTGPTGIWVDCLNQQLSIFDGAFVDQNCTCGVWADGVSAILNVFDGHVVGNEIMPTLAHALALGVTLANPYLEAYPTANKYEISGYQPVQTRSHKTDDGFLQLGLVLDSKFTEGIGGEPSPQPTHVTSPLPSHTPTALAAPTAEEASSSGSMPPVSAVYALVLAALAALCH